MVERESTRTLEAALASSEADADGALAAAKRLQRVVATARKAARTGDLAGLRRALVEAEDAAGEALDRVTGMQDGWAFEDEAAEEGYFASGAYAEELLTALRAAGVDVHAQGEALACYPSLVRIAARSRAITIDRRMVKTVRPSHLAGMLADAQRKGTGFKPGPFLESLHGAYRLLAREDGAMVRLVDAHRALTLLPGVRAEYGQADFARDVYLLDASGIVDARDGSRMRLSPGATASRRPNERLVVVTREGVERSYYGVEFTAGG